MTEKATGSGRFFRFNSCPFEMGLFEGAYSRWMVTQPSRASVSTWRKPCAA